ncbi:MULTISPECIES: hypothetical protein [Priestia]|uniref:hypothetical protein n=1 Tax=Priestia TaxID=2800373 RepID=UPI002D806125|nr:hypothetical protein [Priestia megaterium]
MIEGHDEDSCGKSGTDETPQAAGTQVTRRLSGRPRKAKSCTEINCGIKSGSAHISHLFILDWIHFVMSQPLLMINKKK